MSVILVFGTSGCAKANFLRLLRRYNANYWTTEIEREWEKTRKSADWTVLLGRPQHERQSALENTVRRLKKNIPQNKTSLIGVHATHLVDAFCSSSIPLSALKELPIKFCITLIDDLGPVRHRLSEKGYHYNYQQLLTWRSAELLVADLVAKEVVKTQLTRINVPNFCIGVKHAISQVNKLISNPNLLRVYSAYAITGIHQTKTKSLKDKLKRETLEYRKNLIKKNLIVFDPGTIDDRLLINKVTKKRIKPKYIEINENERWPYKLDDADLRPVLSDPAGLYPIKFPHSEGDLLKESLPGMSRYYNEIDAQITSIDKRYIDQADFITVWRPFNQGFNSLGCREEARYASDSQKMVVTYNPHEDEVKFRRNPQNQSRPLSEKWIKAGRLFPDEIKFWSEIDNVISRLSV